MNSFNERLEERSYLLPKRVSFALTLVMIISEQDNITVTQLIEKTGFSKAYVASCCQGLKRYGILKGKRGSQGGYSLAKDASETIVGEVLEAISKSEDRGVIATSLHRFLIGKAKMLTIKELVNGTED